MSQMIDVPGYGTVEFPDNMSDAQITAAIQNNIARDKANNTYNAPQMNSSSSSNNGASIKNYLSNLQNQSDALRDAFVGGVDSLARGTWQPILQNKYLQDNLGDLTSKALNIATGGSGLLDGILNNPDSHLMQDMGNQLAIDNAKSEERYNQDKEISPIGARAYRGLGYIAGSTPAAALVTMGAPGILGDAIGTNNWVVNPLIGALSSAQSYVPGNDGNARLFNASMGALMGAGATLAGQAIPFLYNNLIPTESNAAKILLKPSVATPEALAQTVAAKEAGDRIGVTLLPSEAPGNPLVAQIEGSSKKLPETSQQWLTAGYARQAQENQFVQNTLNRISPTEISPNAQAATDLVRQSANNIINGGRAAVNAAVEPLYTAANQKIVPKAQLADLMNSDGNIENSINNVLQSPKYRYDLNGFAPNSIKVLDLAKQDLDGQIAAAERSGNYNDVRLLSASKGRLTNATDAYSHEYALARQEYAKGIQPVSNMENGILGKIANTNDLSVDKLDNIFTSYSPRQIQDLKNTIINNDPNGGSIWNQLTRQWMEGKLKNSSATGQNFYNAFLDNDETFNKVLIATQDVPGMTQDLIDAKLSLRNVTHPLTNRTAGGYSATHVDQARSSLEDFRQLLANMFGGQMDRQISNVALNPNWEQYLPMVQKSMNRGTTITPAMLATQYLAPQYALRANNGSQ